MSRCTTNKEAWQLLFDKYNILQKINKNGYFKITAKEINEYREARLMTKFDNSANLPDIFKENNLAILPITSNSYMIARFQPYKKFERIFDERQTNYYTDAGRYLGLIYKERYEGNIVFTLTELGRKILNLRYKQRQLEFVRLILRHKVFYDYLKLYFERAEKPTTIDTIEIMKKCKLYNMESESTYKRRSSTIRGWVEWILELIRV